MKDLFWAILIIFSCFGTGRRILHLFITDFTAKQEEFCFSAALGLGLLAYSVYLLGSVGFLYKKYALLLLSVFFFTGYSPAYKFFRSIRLNTVLKEFLHYGFFEKFLSATIIVIAICCISGALAPATGNDALAYHLQHPKIFINNHKIGYIPYTRESLWPYLTEMLFTLGLILKGAGLANMFHLIFGILSVIAVFSLVKRFFSTKAALLAAGLFYSSPGIFMQSTYAYVDLSLCLYSFLALYSLILWHQQKENKLIILSGIFSGLALSVKLLGGITLLALLAVLLFCLLREKKNSATITKSGSLLILTAIIICCIWYIRSYLILGNPVYPFLNNIFASGWDTHIGKEVGVSRDLTGFLRLPWDLVINFNSFGGEQIGVIFLAFLPMVLFIPLKNTAIRILLIFLLVYASIWFIVDPNIRFAFVNFAVVYILISIGFSRLMEKYNYDILKTLLCLCIVFNLGLCVYYNKDAFALHLGRLSQRDYLLKKERTYAVAEFVNSYLPENCVIFQLTDPRLYYFDRKIIHYPVWQSVSKVNISEYVKNLRAKNTPVYFIDKDSSGNRQFEGVSKNKKPIRVITAKDDSVYRIYE